MHAARSTVTSVHRQIGLPGDAASVRVPSARSDAGGNQFFSAHRRFLHDVISRIRGSRIGSRDPVTAFASVGASRYPSALKQAVKLHRVMFKTAQVVALKSLDPHSISL